MLKVFISQPMKGKTDEQIKTERQIGIEKIKEQFNDDIEILDTFFNIVPDETKTPKPLWFLGKSIQFLGEADIAYFIGEWRNYRGCRIENAVAKEYGIKVIEE